MNAFKKFYVWGMNAKFYMGLYFSAMVFLGGLIVWGFGGDSLGIFTLLQMLLLCMGIAVVQAAMLPDSTDFSRGILFGRSLCWLLLSAAATVGTAILGGWFAGLPGWCSWLMGGFIFLGLAATLIGLKFEQEADTLRLNDSLQRFQQK